MHSLIKQWSLFTFFKFQFSDIEESSDCLKGSERHANAVMAKAKYWFGKLTNEEEEEKREKEDEEKEEKKQKKNLFKPKVLVRVSHNGQCFVGSSVAVSHFLRPLCLYKRICDFKQSLKKAVVDYQPLELTEDKFHWNSSAVWFQGEKKTAYETVKLPCKNCKFMFQKLSGFLGEEGAIDKPVGGNFLAACGEYPPINQCLHDAESDNEVVNGALKKFGDKCVLYYQKFRENVQNCIEAYKLYQSEEDESKKLKILRNAYDEYVKDKIHIFGIKPECNNNLSHNVWLVNLPL